MYVKVCNYFTSNVKVFVLEFMFLFSHGLMFLKVCQVTVLHVVA